MKLFNKTKKIQILIFLFFVFCNQIIGQSQVSVEDLLKKEKLSGTVWTIIKEDSISTFSAGFNNLATKEKLNANNKVHIASMNKPEIALGFGLPFLFNNLQ